MTHRPQLPTLERIHGWRLLRCLRLGLDERTIHKRGLDDPTSIVFDCVLQRVLDNKARGRGGRRIAKFDIVRVTQP
jgi:hypothetical protein